MRTGAELHMEKSTVIVGMRSTPGKTKGALNHTLSTEFLVVGVSGMV
jgi:hypothetical protein